MAGKVNLSGRIGSGRTRLRRASTQNGLRLLESCSSRVPSVRRQGAKCLVTRNARFSVAIDTGDLAGAAASLDEAMEVDRNLAGDRFEQQVSDDTEAREVHVNLTCRACGLVLAEFDVVTHDGIVKECKSSWNQVNEDQFMREQALAQRPDVFGPGTVVHLAIPKGQRGRLDRKFGNKANAAGKIQEH